jgi:serine/threonine protein kinase
MRCDLGCGGRQLADFGLSRVLLETSTSFTGTPVFMAPEILSGNPYTKESDIFSLGTTIYMLCMLKVPFQSVDILELKVHVPQHSHTLSRADPAWFGCD